MNDLRFACRMLARSRGFTLAAAGLLAAGIGVTTLIFSAVDAILLRPLPVNHPEQLVRLVQRVPRAGTISAIPILTYEHLRDRSTTLTQVFGEAAADYAMSEPLPAEQISIRFCTPEFFTALGVHALIGRTLTPDDAKEQSGAPAAVLSYGFWQRRFNGGSNALGKTIRVRDTIFTIVGVLPREFNGFTVDTAPDVRVPLRTFPQIFPDDGPHGEYARLDLGARLKPGANPKTAEAEARGMWQTDLAHMDRIGWGPEYPLMLDPLETGTSILRDQYAVALKFLIACASLLLLMICTNVAGLLLARSAARRQEIAVRLAVGATRVRLARQMLVESAVLASLGAAGGIGLAVAASPLLLHLLPPIHDLGSNRLQISLDAGIDRRVLLFSLAISVATVLLFGLAPAVAASRTSLSSILRGARSNSAWRGRQMLILTQVALCTVLLTGAGLLIQTFERLRNLNPGFDPSHVVSFTLEPAAAGYPLEQLPQFGNDLTERIRQIPGVASVALAERGVLRDRGLGATVVPEGHIAQASDVVATGMNGVTPDYFETMGMRLLEGSLFSAAEDLKKNPWHVVVNQALVQKFFPGQDPLGKRFGNSFDGHPANANFEIAGVVNEAKYRSLRQPIQPMVYTPAFYNGGLLIVHVRSRGKPETMIQPVRRVIASVNATMPIIEIDTLADEVDASAAGERLTATLGSIFAVLAVLLSAAGIYGLLAYAVAQRRREIGIRMALGATPSHVHSLIGKQALGIVIGGVVLGLAAAHLTAPLIASLLYGVAPQDLRSLGEAALVVLAIAAVAAAVPAGRAARINPAVALRDDQ